MRPLCSMLLLILLAQRSLAQEKGPTDPRLAGIDSSMAKVLQNHRAAGFAVAIVENDKVLYSKGFGYRDLAQKKPVTANTLFAIGSCTKSFTAALLGQLEKEGGVSLDGKAREYLPALHFYNEDLDNEITIRDMMCHRTGLSRYDRSWYVFKTPSRDSVLTRIRYMKPTEGFREKWQYNNYMYMVQAMIAEKMTGHSWEENIKEKIFTPLGMRRSNTSIQDMLKDEDAALPYGTEEEKAIREMDYYEMESMRPAGGINSSALEMSNWLRVWTNGGKFNGTAVLPPAFVREAMSAQMVVNSGLPGDQHDIHFLNYGLGWFLRSYRGHYQVEHDGNIDGFSSWIAFFPAEGLGIIVLANQQFSQVPEIVSNLLSDRLLQLNPLDWNQTVKKEAPGPAPVSGRVPDTHPSHRLAEYQGSFENPAYGDIRIAQQHDSLFASLGEDRYWLAHYHYDVFEARKISARTGIDTAAGSLRINFRFGENGKVDGISLPLEASMDPMVEFTHVQRAVQLGTNELKFYAGVYKLGEGVVRVFLLNDHLYLLAPGQPEYRLIPLGNHQFNLNELTGYSVSFTTDATGVTGFTFFKPDGTSFKVPKEK